MSASKKTVGILLVLIILVSATVFFVLNREKSITNYPSKGHDIVAFGDSLVEGVGASARSKNFVSLLAKKLGKPIINLGQSGDTTQDGLDRLSDLNNYDPKVVLLLFGGNDSLRKVLPDTTFVNLSKIIENIQARGAVVILLGVRGNLLSDTYASKFEELADKYGTAYVPDVLDGLFGNTKFMSDVVHPNDLGYQNIADRIYPVLLKVL